MAYHYDTFINTDIAALFEFWHFGTDFIGDTDFHKIPSNENERLDTNTQSSIP